MDQVLVVVAILGVLAAIVVPNVLQFMGEGAEEAARAEHHNVQTSVLALLADAEVHQLDESYFDVQEKSDIDQVTATADGTAYTLDQYLLGGFYPLKQSYDIWKNGSVSVHSE